MTNNSKMNFSRKKKVLLKTRTEFDGSSGSSEINNEDGMNSRLVLYNTQQPIPNSLVIQALIHQLCKYMEPDEEKRVLFYTDVCRILNGQEFLGLNFDLNDLSPVTEAFCVALSTFFTEVHRNVSSQGLGSCTSVSIRGAFDYIRTTDYGHYSNRYHQNYEELETIAKGGFGVVCKARNKLDDITYAVKKIKFKYTNDLEYEKVLREVRSLAQLKHQNIVTYNNSWLETNIGTESIKTDSDSESSSSDNDQQNTNSPFRSDGSADCAVSPVVNLSPEASASYKSNPSGQSNDLTSLLIDATTSTTDEKLHSILINSEIQITSQNVLIKEQSEVLETSEAVEHTEWYSEVYYENYKFSASEQLEQTVHGAECGDENSNVKDNVICYQANECGDGNQKTSRRRRHSSGATCSVTDQDGEISKKDSSHRRSYDRFNSVDLDPRRCTALVPKTANAKWDISNLGVIAILYIQMELCDRSLRDWLEERAEKMPSSCCEPSALIMSALETFEQIVQGVEHIHSKFIIHRDLKPKNIFLCSDGCIKIGDFGLAALCTQTDQQEFFCHTRCSCNHTQGLGTAPYAAPEQRKHGSYDKRVDIYSLGIILIELLLCFQTRMEFCLTVDRIIEGNIPEELVNIWPDELVNLIRRLTSQTPQERPEANEILSHLRRIKMAKSLGISSSHQDFRNKENEALEIYELKAQVRDLKKQFAEKDKERKAQIRSLEKQLQERDEKIKELQLQLLCMKNCDSTV